MKYSNDRPTTSSSQSMIIVVVFLAIFSLIVFYVFSMQRSSVQNQTELTPDSVITPSPVVPNGQEEQDDQVFCTLDAQVCPDGSYVGRVPPSCEFAPCPEADASEQEDTQTDTIDLQISY